MNQDQLNPLVLTGDQVPARTRAENTARVPRWLRNAVLSVHIITSVGVIGADLALITLGLSSLTTASPELIRSSYILMALLTENVLMALAFGALLSGILLGLRSQWGLTRYYWVLTKLVLTIVTLSALVVFLRPRISQAAADALQLPLTELVSNGIGQSGILITAAPAGSLVVLVVTTLLAVYKPWGKTPFARR